jgi:2-keto-4-pentenoate hydratase
MDTPDTTTTRLLQARRSGRAQPAAAPADAEAAYAVQAAVAQALGWFHTGVPRHWKSGGPSRQAVATHAPLPPAGVWASPALAGAWPFHQRGIEAEVALRLGTAVDASVAAGLDLPQARALVDAQCVSIEVVDSRWAEGLQAPALAKLADLQSHGALVLGAWTGFDAEHDWAAQRCSVQIGAQPARDFQGTHAMGDPAFVLLAWLRHATRDGVVLPAGTVVTTGTWCGILPAQAGERVLVQFPGIGEASLQL